MDFTGFTIDDLVLWLNNNVGTAPVADEVAALVALRNLLPTNAPEEIWVQKVVQVAENALSLAASYRNIVDVKDRTGAEREAMRRRGLASLQGLLSNPKVASDAEVRSIVLSGIAEIDRRGV